MTPQHGDKIVSDDGKASLQFQEFLDDLDFTVVSIPPNLSDGKTRKRIVNIWLNETDGILEWEAK